MKVNVKCHNYAGCLLAYRGEEIPLESDAPRVCPECGKPVTISNTTASRLGLIAAILLLLGAVAAGAWFWKQTKEPAAAGAPTIAATPSESGRLEPKAVGPNPAATPAAKSTAKSAEPPQAIAAPQEINLNLGAKQNQKVKAEVLKRIDVMPNISAGNKDKLYYSVERAQSMGLVLTIPFTSGKTTITTADIQTLKGQLETPQMMKLRENATAVFVILGYADPKGDEKKNVEISQVRADAVLTAMKDKCGVQNVMHSVAMGGSTLLDSQDLEKNRIVEIWAVLP